MRAFILLVFFGGIVWPQQADVYITPTAQGDVSLFVFSNHDDAEAVRAATGCEALRVPESGYVSATCRDMLPTRSGVADGVLDLTALVSGLHDAGEETVTVQIVRNRATRVRGANWRAASRGSGQRKEDFLQFISRSAEEVPAPLEIRMGAELDPEAILVPALIVVFVPGLLALWLEWRRSPAAMVWLNWILLTSWLYWISAIDTGRLVTLAGDGGVSSIGVIFGAAFFSIPPLLSTASCTIALAPRLLPGSHTAGEFARLMNRQLSGIAARLIPLGIFLAGTAALDDQWQAGVGSMAAAALAWRALSWWAARDSYIRMSVAAGGEFHDRVMALARRAGVQISKIHVFRTRSDREANAFALSAGRVAITESLLRNLTRREVDAVMAHEIGHLKGRHVRMQYIFYVLFFLLAGPAVDLVARTAGLPAWSRSVPVAAIAFTLAMAYVSKRHEFAADARAAEITGDPEAKIAALARLAKLTSSPLDWGGIQGSILSHPSMKSRVLAIARASRLPESRALELLENPDLLGAQEYYSVAG